MRTPAVLARRVRTLDCAGDQERPCPAARGRARAGHESAGALLRVHPPGVGRRGRDPVHRARVRRHLARRDRRRGRCHQGRALPPLLRQAGAVRGRLREGRVGRRRADPGSAQGPPRPVGEGDRRAPSVPRGGAAAVVQPDRGAGRPVRAGVRAIPGAGGAVDVRVRAGHRPRRARCRRLEGGRRDGAHLRPHLLRCDVIGGVDRLDCGRRRHRGGSTSLRLRPGRRPAPARSRCGPPAPPASVPSWWSA